MIESISMKDIANFDFNGIQLTKLKKINLIYGSNDKGVKVRPDPCPNCFYLHENIINV